MVDRAGQLIEDSDCPISRVVLRNFGSWGMQSVGWAYRDVGGQAENNRGENGVRSFEGSAGTVESIELSLAL